jgi:glutathione S-transferase
MTRLYHFALSPFCRKVRLVLAEKKIEVELVDEKYWEPSIEFLQSNPAGKVPVLKIDGLTLTESGAICEYIEETHPDPALMPSDPRARAEVRRLVAWFDDKFHHEVTKNLVYERVNKKVMRAGYPTRQGGEGRGHGDQVSPALHGMAAGPPPLAGGRPYDAGRFRRRGAYQLPRLHLGRGLDVEPAGQGLVRHDEVAARLPVDPVRPRIRASPQPPHYANLDF